LGGTGVLPTLDFFPHLWGQTVHYTVIVRFVYITAIHETSVSDPYSIDTDMDPDPALKAEYPSGSRVLMIKN
jgi:hypothetical protein